MAKLISAKVVGTKDLPKKDFRIIHLTYHDDYTNGEAVCTMFSKDFSIVVEDYIDCIVYGGKLVPIDSDY